VGELSYDIGYATYVYPTGKDNKEDGENDKIGELAEYIYSVGYGPVSLTVYDNVDTNYTYTTVGYDIADFSLMYGVHDNDTALGDQENFDITYAYSDSISFTYSTPFGSDKEEAEPTFVASYSLPL